MKGGKKIQIMRPNRINYEIRATEVRLTDENGVQLGIMSLRQALEKSTEAGVDLVEISSNANPPVCRIIDYGKFLYEKNKSSKEQKKKQKIIQIKEIKFRPNTDEGDYKIKLRNLIKFLNLGDKTKVTIRFRGREMAHQQIGIDMLNRIKNDLIELSTVEFFPSKIEGRQMIMMLAPKKK
ncbi:translation initiation factor IF-3 [Candidatus Tachikawaea gelatinosa]|nr:translation initiation factor IF-3 [Candidatus Tachikawaea gelatinosa]